MLPKKGDTLKIRLEENPTTGFVWKNYSSEKIEMLSQFYMSHDNLVGSGGKKTFTVQVQNNDMEIVMKLLRPWVPDDIIDTFILNLQVEYKRHGVSESLLIS